MRSSFRRLGAASVMAVGLPLVLMAGTANASTARVAPAIGAVAAAVPAASADNCANSPSNANCNGAPMAENGACWDTSYVVDPNSGGEYFYSQNGYTFETDLRYSTLCKSNFSVTTVTQTGAGVFNFSGKVRRGPGPDGPYLMEHGGWYLAYPWSGGAAVLSPLVYSPDNPGQACFSDNSSDQVGCTSYL